MVGNILATGAGFPGTSGYRRTVAGGMIPWRPNYALELAARSPRLSAGPLDVPNQNNGLHMVDLAKLNSLRARIHELNPNAVLDGAVSPDRYASSNPRIVWILRETNGDGGWDLCEFLEDHSQLLDYSRWAATYGAIAKISKAFQESLRPVALASLRKRDRRAYGARITGNFRLVAAPDAERQNARQRSLQPLLRISKTPSTQFCYRSTHIGTKSEGREQIPALKSR